MILSPQPLQRAKSLHEQAYQALRTGILSGELAPGDRLVETQLAQWLHVSRTPLREALRQLQREGLVAAEPNGGLRVSTISAADAIHLYDCRLALEQLAVAEACKHATKAQLKKLEKYVNQAETLEQHPTKPTLIQLLDLDYQFHHLIAESSANQRLISLLDNVFDAMLLLRIQTLRRNPEVLNIRLEHRQIYEAIAQHDTAAAVEAIATHLTASKARVVQEIQRQRE
ncbi:MAG: GntR family transcriptional regulator [Oculatellaceae cyanobacterium bins.114]|nr:GntR family transcriptional regulator [Oculatellaceae cyanobacterium bins.114]